MAPGTPPVVGVSPLGGVSRLLCPARLLRRAPARKLRVRSGFHDRSDAAHQVASESPASPAARAGLAPGDLIVEVDGKPILSLADWTVVEGTVEFGRPIHLRVLRRGDLSQVALTLAPAPWSYWRTEPGVILLGVLGLPVRRARLRVPDRPETSGRSRRAARRLGARHRGCVHHRAAVSRSARCGGTCPRSSVR